MAIPSRVRIFEVGARDGLQNEKQMVPSDIKVELIERLVDAGVTSIETGSFVSRSHVENLAPRRCYLCGINPEYEGV